MASDAAIDKMIYGGRVPIQFELASREMTGDDEGPELEPFYLLAPRGGYLTLCCEKIRRHFQPDQPRQNQDRVSRDMWFEYNGRALKWNHPIGVLYDSFASGDGLPWRIVVHTQMYPSSLLRCEGKDAIEAHFIAQLKKASYLKHGTTKVDGLSSERDRKQLFIGLADDDYEQFRQVNEKLMTPRDGHWFKHIPFRVYVVDLDVVAAQPENNVEVIELPFPSYKEDGSPNTLQDLISALGLAAPGKAVLHGVEPATDTPLQWMSEHLSHPDNILHMVWMVGQDY